MKLTRFVFIASVVFAAIAGSISVPSSSARILQKSTESTNLFSYDVARPLDVKEVSVKEQDGVTIKDIEYAANSGQRGRVKAFLIRPAGKGPFAGVLFFHWLGEVNGNRNQFVDEAVSLAKQDTVSLLIQGYFPWQVEPSDGETDRRRVIEETVDVRRALDLLLAQPNVDRKRIGFVGHDYGAMYGSLLSSVDKRVKTYVLIAGTGSFSTWSLDYWLKAKPADFKDAYRQSFKMLEPSGLIGRAAPAAVLFQFANTDKYISKEAAMEFYNAAKEPKEIKWYDTIHEMNIESARQDRRTWLAEKLKLGK